MKKRDFQFLSADKKTKIHAVKWEPDGKELKGILQISHGMVEYVERYEKFAEFMVQQGFLVAGNDHLYRQNRHHFISDSRKWKWEN